MFDNVPTEMIVSTAQALTAQAYLFDESSQQLSEQKAKERDEFQTDQLQNGINFVAISRPDARKGSLETIQAFAKWATEHPDKKGTLILGAHKPEEGKTSQYQDSLVEMVKSLDTQHPDLHLRERILLLPSLAADQVRTLYALPGAVGVCPSLSEPFGLVGLEMTGSGIPVIGTRTYQSTNGIAQDQTFETTSVLRCAPGAVPQMASAMKAVTKDYDRFKRAAVENAQAVIDEFNWEKSGETRKAVYDRTVAANQIVPFAGNETPDARVEKPQQQGMTVPDFPPPLRVHQ